jgi:hypothetical protein
MKRPRARGRASCRWLCHALAALCVAAPSPARAQSLEQGRELYLAARFRPAIEAFSAVLEREDAAPAEVAEAHVYLATLLLLTGEEELAGEHAAAAVLQEADIAAPEGAPEELRALLDRTRALLSADRASPPLSLSREQRHDGRALIRARLASGVGELVARLTLRCQSDGAELEPVVGPPHEVELQLAGEADDVFCEALGFGPAGVTIVRLRGWIEPGPTVRPRLSPWVWVGVGVGVAAATALALTLALALPRGEVTINRIDVEGW